MSYIININGFGLHSIVYILVQQFLLVFLHVNKHIISFILTLTYVILAPLIFEF